MRFLNIVRSLGLSLSLVICTSGQAQAATATLTWTDNADNEAGVAIENKVGASGTYVEIARVGQNVTSYTDVNVVPGEVNFYRLYAFNATGNSAYSNEAAFTAAALTLTVTKAVSRCRFTLTANPPDNTGGWTAEFKRGEIRIGALDTSSPYMRTPELVIGNYSFTVTWTKSGQPTVTSDPVAMGCP